MIYCYLDTDVMLYVFSTFSVVLNVRCSYVATTEQSWRKATSILPPLFIHCNNFIGTYLTTCSFTMGPFDC